jgi:hypothetical protein
MRPTPHLDKLTAALTNPKCPASDRNLLEEARKAYTEWIRATEALTSKGRERVNTMVELLNHYKDMLEVELIAKKASEFLKRQKGQLKLDNSVIEEFLPHLVRPEIIPGINHARYEAGPQSAFMSLSFMPRSFAHIGRRPEVIVKVKDQDFAIGSTVYYKFSSSTEFVAADTESGEFALAVLAAESKINLDKTMFQEAAGTAARLKQGCPVARYYLLVEYLDMTPEDPRLTAIDNVYLLRKAKRLPFEKRSDAGAVEAQHRDFPIASEIVWAFVSEISKFVEAVWYNPDDVLRRGTFV